MIVGFFLIQRCWRLLEYGLFIMKIVTIKKKHQLAGAGRGGWFVTRPPFLGKLFQKSPEPA